MLMSPARAKDLIKANKGLLRYKSSDTVGFHWAEMENPIDPERPFDIVVHPIPEARVLRFHVTNVGHASKPDPFMHVVALINGMFNMGRVYVNSDTRDIIYELNHLCSLDGSVEEPSAEMFRELVQAVKFAVITSAVTLLKTALLDSGIPNDVINEIVAKKLGKKREPLAKEVI